MNKEKILSLLTEHWEIYFKEIMKHSIIPEEYYVSKNLPSFLLTTTDVERTT